MSIFEIRFSEFVTGSAGPKQKKNKKKFSLWFPVLNLCKYLYAFWFMYVTNGSNWFEFDWLYILYTYLFQKEWPILFVCFYSRYLHQNTNHQFPKIFFITNTNLQSIFWLSAETQPTFVRYQTFNATKFAK